MAEASRAFGALFCDTNVLARLISGEPRHQARAAGRALDALAERGRTTVVSDVVAAELAYVLDSGTSLPRAKAAALVGSLLTRPGLEVADEALLRDALTVWGSTRFDFADAYLASLARRTHGGRVLSFDRDFDRIPGVRRVDPHGLTR